LSINTHDIQIEMFYIYIHESKQPSKKEKKMKDFKLDKETVIFQGVRYYFSYSDSEKSDNGSIGFYKDGRGKEIELIMENNELFVEVVGKK
jgi:hypothetical protein